LLGLQLSRPYSCLAFEPNILKSCLEPVELRIVNPINERLLLFDLAGPMKLFYRFIPRLGREEKAEDWRDKGWPWEDWGGKSAHVQLDNPQDLQGIGKLMWRFPQEPAADQMFDDPVMQGSDGYLEVRLDGNDILCRIEYA